MTVAVPTLTEGGYSRNDCDCGPHTVIGPDGYSHAQYGPTVSSHPGGYSRAIG